MKKPVIAIVVIVLALAAYGYRRHSKNASESQPSLTKVTLVQEWFPQANYAGAILAAKEFGPKNGLDIVIQPGADDAPNPVFLVAANKAQFADIGADRVLAAINSSNADVVIIGVVNIDSPTCFLSKTNRNIKTPQDFENHTVGVLTGTATEYIYRTLLLKHKLDKSKIKEVEIPFELTTFITDQYDVRPAFIYDEPVSLDLQNVKYDTLEPKNWGVSFVGTVYITSGKYIREHRDKVQAFVDSVADGWRMALKYPDRAIHELKLYKSDIDEKRELLSFNKGRAYFEGRYGKPLLSDPRDWQEMINELQALKVVGNVTISNVVDDTFIRDYYKRLEGHEQ